MLTDDHSRGWEWAYVNIPVGVSLVALGASVWLDLHHLGNPANHWTARSGAIIALCGGISAYGGATRVWETVGTGQGARIRSVRGCLPYSKVGLVLGVLGTLIWAYADFWL